MRTKKIGFGILLMLSLAVTALAQGSVYTVTGITAGNSAKDAPYSAETTTESIKTLGDGNRIIRKTRTVTYRDSEGRMRNENYFKSDVPEIYISDPVAKTAYILNPGTKTARRVPVTSYVFMSPKGFGNTSATGTLTGVTTARSPAPLTKATGTTVTSTSTDAAPAAVSVFSAAPFNGGATTFSSGALSLTAITIDSPAGYSTKDEALGARTIEGVEANGKRTTTTIPAGAIGNEKVIEKVSETWYSKDLGLVVLSTRTDPEYGNFTTKVSNIKRDEPNKSLFTVPADYKIIGETTAAKPE